MKKKLILLIAVVAVLFPFSSFAKTYYDGYATMNFVETLQAEGMEIENKDYKEDSKQATIYIFRGQGCGFCRKLLSYLNSISNDYGKYFKVVSFEVWNDSKNSALMSKVATLKGDSANGVPYYIIGDETFGGYSEEYNDRIVKAIMNVYNNDDSKDVFKELEASEKKSNSSGSSDIFATVFWNIIIVVIAAGIVIYFNNKNKEEIISAIKESSKSKK